MCIRQWDTQEVVSDKYLNWLTRYKVETKENLLRQLIILYIYNILEIMITLICSKVCQLNLYVYKGQFNYYENPYGV